MFDCIGRVWIVMFCIGIYLLFFGLFVVVLNEYWFVVLCLCGVLGMGGMWIVGVVLIVEMWYVSCCGKGGVLM